jgi:hypothetical protein
LALLGRVIAGSEQSGQADNGNNGDSDNDLILFGHARDSRIELLR